MRIIVVGAGVAGLTTAIRLLEAGNQVTVVTADQPTATTSAVAAAVWYPYRAEPRSRVLAWSARTGEVLRELAEQGAGGVRSIDCLELVRPGVPDPWFHQAVVDFRRAEAAELPGGQRAGWWFRTVVADMGRYLPWLLERMEQAGGTLEQDRVAALSDVTDHAEAVVCCVGLGARELLGDVTVTPVRGQVVVVANPGLERVLIDDARPDQPTYIVPRGDDCVLGGTADEDAWSTQPDPSVSASILRRCRALEPALADVPVLAEKAGLRPVRPAIRLEVEMIDGTPTVHNYGHGGAGVTLSWGCAEEVVKLLGAGR